MDEKLVNALIEAVNAQTATLKQIQTNGNGTQKAAASVQTAAALHGPGGVFQGPGLERDVITAYVRPEGIGSVLPKFPSVTTDPRFAALTGYTATTGDEPTNACDDAPYGFVKSCILTSSFGLLRRDTGTIEMDKVMLKVNRGDFTDLVLRGRVLGLMDAVSPSGLNESQILNVVTMSEMVGVGVQVERALSTRYWQGTVAAGQMPGLDVQIATGQVDALTNTACPALDSDVKEFNYNDVCGSGLDIVEYMSMLEFYLRTNARKMGLNPVRWVIAMRPELWFELSACWPCRYMSNRCKDDSGSQLLVVNDNVNINERDRMRDNMQIPINGNWYDVVLDDGIFEHDSTNNANVPAGSFASSIYFVPITIAGNYPATRIEYIDYRQAGMDTALLRGKEDYWWTDAGMYSWAIENNKWCYKLALKTEQRIVLQAPHLAGRIDHVMYAPLQHIRSPYPDSSYNMDGGVSIRGTSPLYAVWR